LHTYPPITRTPRGWWRRTTLSIYRNIETYIDSYIHTPHHQDAEEAEEEEDDSMYLWIHRYISILAYIPPQHQDAEEAEEEDDSIYL